MLFEAFLKLENKWDILDYIKDNNIPMDDDKYLCYKIEGEYGITIEIVDSTLNKYLHLFLDTLGDENKITSFLYNNAIGLFEKIYSNRTEYFINGEYYKNDLDEKLDEMQNKFTKSILIDKIFPKLYEFIIGDEEIVLFDTTEFEDQKIIGIIEP